MNMSEIIVIFHGKEFREQINHFFNDILSGIVDELKSRISDNFQVLIPAF